MKRILVTGAGGSPAVNFVRSLRAADEPMYIIGADSDKYTLQRAETDERYLVPSANDKNYIKVLKDIIKETGAEFLHTQNDYEVDVISAKRDQLPITTFFPAKKTVEICLNKFSSYEIWAKAGLPQPTTMMIHNEDDLKEAFKKWKKIWIRDVVGAAGKGSLPAEDYKVAKAWLDFKSGWGNYSAAEMLGSQSVTWQSIWKNGKLITAQSRKRLYYEFANRAPSGITGLTGTGVTVTDKKVDEMSKKAILAIDKKPHGIFSVDMTYDSKDRPNPTEINIARFFTTHEFFTRAGLNMPYILVQLAYGETPTLPKETINPLTPDLAWIRGLDFLPVLTNTSTIDQCEKELKVRLKRLEK